LKRYFGLIVLVVGVISAAVMLQRSAKERTLEAQREADIARIQKDYLERVGWMRTNPDETSYRNELAPFFKAYFTQVSEHQDRYNLSKEFDAYLTELEQRGADDARANDRKAYYEYTRKVFDQMREGRYRPLWTATDKGMRLDILSNDVVMVMNKPQLRMQVALWGAQRELREDGRVKKMLTSASFNAMWKLTDAKGRLVGEMTGTDPSMKIDHPERFISEFPPQMVLGHYDLDPLPAEVKTMELTLKVSSRSSSGGEVASTYVWKTEVPADWKLREGEAWEGATVSERPEEEIDPAKAEQKK
jgi:hypothetical protein